MGYICTSSWWDLGLLLLVLMCETGGQSIEWTMRPESVSRREGDNVTFVCRLSVEDHNIIWVKDNGGNVTILFVKSERFDADRQFSIQNQYDLVISNITRNDNGNYACRTKDAGIQKASLTVLLYPGPPRITKDDNGPVYTEGQIVRFTCSSTGGNPKPTITWLKNGNLTSEIPEMREDGLVAGTINSTIRVNMDRSDDRANYSCIVYNDLNTNNKLMDNIVLSVLYSPSIAFQPYSPIYTVKVGDSVEITCDVDANPPVNLVTWFKDGVRLAGSSTKRIISSISKADHGNYTCTAKNSIGEQSGFLDVNVQYIPNIILPANLTVKERGDITITCDIDANPAPYEVQWSKVTTTGMFQSLINSRTLKIPFVNRTQAGNYSCRAQSQLRVSGKSVEFVSAESFINIYVQYKPGPAIISPVSDLDVGDRLDITCTAFPNGYPEASYSWTKDGKKLSTNKQTLSVTSVSLSDNGRYSCTPVNVIGSGDSAAVEVHVYEPPSIIKSPQPELSVYLTDKQLLNLTCRVKGHPQPQVMWYQEGDTQPLNTRPELFTVVMTTSTQNTYSVSVESTLLFKGSSRERPPQSSQTTALMTRDMGNYSCRAESEKHLEKPAAYTMLLINFSPILESSSTRLAVSKMDKAELICSAQAYPEASFLWFFQGQPLTSGRSGVVIMQESLGGIGRVRSKLTIMTTTERSYGTYKCLVANALGNTSQEILLSAKTVPEAPKNLTSLSVTWESVLLTWTPGFDGGLDQKFYIQKLWGSQEATKTEVIPGSSPAFNVTKLRPSTTYTFQVVAENQIGSSPVSLPIIVTTNYLQIPSLPKIPVFDTRNRRLSISQPSPQSDFCLKVEVKGERAGWSIVNGCMKVLGDSVELVQSGIAAVNVSVCLSYRSDVCGNPLTAEIYSADKEITLTEEHVIIIACVCGVIIVTLLIILFCFIFRRRRNAEKVYQGGNQGDPPPYNAVPPNKKQAYDNQDNGAGDGFVNRDGLNSNVPHSPAKDKYIGLQERGGGGGDHMAGEGGDSILPTNPKPKKVVYEVVV